MPNLAKTNGLGGYKNRKFGTEYAAKHNEIVAINLKSAMFAVPKYLLGGYAATALNLAIKHTKHDSSRFAANWNLAVGNGPLHNDGNPDPLEYREEGASYGAIGEKESKGANRLAVQMAKRMYYGYTNSAKGSDMMKLTKGRLAEALYPHAKDEVKKTKGQTSSLSGMKLSFWQKVGIAPRVYLYNPFMRPDYAPFRKDTWQPRKPTNLRNGRTYPQNALPKGGITQVTNEVSAVMGQGFLQEIIVKMAGDMRMANKANRLLDPFA
jgi:hypothetical protein